MTDSINKTNIKWENLRLSLNQQMEVLGQHLKIIWSPATWAPVKMPGVQGEYRRDIVWPPLISPVCDFSDALWFICSSLQETYSQQYFEFTGKCFTWEPSWKTLSGTKTENCCLSVTMMDGALGGVCAHTLTHGVLSCVQTWQGESCGTPQAETKNNGHSVLRSMQNQTLAERPWTLSASSCIQIGSD